MMRLLYPPYYSSADIIKKIRSYNCISFDVFDTLLKRKVIKPKDIFKIVGKKFSEELRDRGISDFVSARAKAEKIAILHTENKKITIEKIYKELLPNDDGLREKMIEYEISTEINNTVVNNEIKDVYDWCIENKKRIIAISDMYLSEKVIYQMLCKCGYRDVEKIFVSSAYGETKREGKLFLLAKYYIGSEFIHIGDAFRSDYISPIKNGFPAIWISKECRHNPEGTEMRPSKSLLDHIFCISTKSNWDPYYYFGFRLVGPLLYNMCKWIHCDAQKKGLEKLFFLSRDGFLIQKVYKTIFTDKALDNRYLYVSRRALRKSQLRGDLNLKKIVTMFPEYTYINMEDFCDGIGLDKVYAYRYWIESGLKPEEYLLPREFLTNKKFVRFFESVKNILEKESEAEFDLIAGFLKENGFEGKIGIVDIGWAGTIQRCLQHIAVSSGLQTKIFGYYLGLAKKSARVNYAASFLPFEEQIQEFVAPLVEYPFLAPEGSVLNYIDSGTDGIIPCLGNYEYAGLDKEIEIIENIQKGAIDFSKFVKEEFGEVWFDDNEVVTAYKYFLRHPNKKTLRYFGGLHYYDGSLKEMVLSKPLMYYIQNPLKFKWDLSESGWKIGFLYELAKIKFPYYRLLKAVKERK